MIVLTYILGILGGLSAATGIVAALDMVPFLAGLPAGFTPMFWLVLAAVLMLGCIATLLTHSEYE